MKRIWLFLSVCLLLYGCATAPVSKGKGAVAIWDLENLSIPGAENPGFNLDDMGELLSSKIIEALNRESDLTIVERERLVLALEELNIGSTSLVDETTRLKVGKIVGAKMMVLGGYMVVGEQMRLDLRLVEVETGKILSAAQRIVAASDMSAWLKAAEEAAGELL